jgi:hypothetical protein
VCRKAAGRGENGEESEPESKESERSPPDDEGGRARKQKPSLDLPKVPPLHCKCEGVQSPGSPPTLTVPSQNLKSGGEVFRRSQLCRRSCLEAWAR